MPSAPGSVIVVGAGPAGATLAYLLASRRVPVTLLDRQRDFSREFRGELLLPSGLAALDEMGLAEVFKGVPQKAPWGIEFHANAKRVFQLEIDSAFVGPNRPVAFSQPAFLEAVIAAARAHPGFRVELGTSVGELLYSGDRVVGVKTRSEGSERELRADLVIGADGRTSAVRRRGGFEAIDHGFGLDVVWFKVPLPEFMGSPAPVRVYIGRAHLLIAYQAPDGLLQVAWVITKGSYGDLRRRGVEDWVAEISDHVTPDLAEHLRANRGALSSPFLLSAVSDRVVHWTRPGALVIGDAAHTMSPVGGQGINIALRDALVAANHLVPALLAGADPERIDTATRAIEDERTPELVAIQRLQGIAPKILMRRTWWSAALRAVIPRLLRFGSVRNRAARVIQPLLFGRGEVRLRV
ncbi:MAG: FAD-dependent monooxygenase [Proteobacteria bacterium]|nr:FAD-dependent monooxygenase [Pseudomonadota bacterium]